MQTSVCYGPGVRMVDATIGGSSSAQTENCAKLTQMIARILRCPWIRSGLGVVIIED